MMMMFQSLGWGDTLSVKESLLWIFYPHLYFPVVCWEYGIRSGEYKETIQGLMFMFAAKASRIDYLHKIQHHYMNKQYFKFEQYWLNLWALRITSFQNGSYMQILNIIILNTDFECTTLFVLHASPAGS